MDHLGNLSSVWQITVLNISAICIFWCSWICISVVKLHGKVFLCYHLMIVPEQTRRMWFLSKYSLINKSDNINSNGFCWNICPLWAPNYGRRRMPEGAKMVVLPALLHLHLLDGHHLCGGGQVPPVCCL